MNAGDADVVARVLAGARDEYAVLVRRYQDPLYRHALGMVGSPDAAEDLVQESLIRGYERLSSCKDPDRFASWIFRVLRNRCLDYLKNRRREMLPLEEETAFATDADDPGLALERLETGDRIGRALAALPEAQREAFLLKHVEGRSYEEMAELLEASESALKMRVMRAREALQAMLGAPERANM